jgi:GT2 family glycosyltransferase
MEQPAVWIIILNYNGRDDTLACLKSLRHMSYPNAHILVVDNGSHDNSVAAFRSAYPHLDLLETGENLGFAAGNNRGIAKALEHGAEYVLLLNNDTEVQPDFLTQLVQRCQNNPTIGAAGPKIYYHDKPQTIWSAGGSIDWQRGTSHMIALDQPDSEQYNQARQVDFLTGCALLVRSSAIQQAGLLDERFGMYYEETEWCVRLARAGWSLWYEPKSVILHKIKPVQQNQSPRITYYMTRNRLLFLRLTHAPLRAWLHALVLQDLRTWCSWRIKKRWQGKRDQRLALVQGWRDFLHQRFGMVPWEA